MSRFDREECGELMNMLNVKSQDLMNIRFTQPVLLRSFEDEFGLLNRAAPTPARVGDVLTKSSEKDVLPPKMQTKHRSAVALPPIHNIVRYNI